MQVEMALKKWSRDANSKLSSPWTGKQLRDFWEASHRAARIDPLSSGTRHIDGTCPAHSYAQCACDECVGRPRHSAAPSAKVKTQGEIEADRKAEEAAYYAELEAEAQAELDAYAREYDNVPAMESAPAVEATPAVAAVETTKRLSHATARKLVRDQPGPAQVPASRLLANPAKTQQPAAPSRTTEVARTPGRLAQPKRLSKPS